MELWDIIDGNESKTGKTIERGKPTRQDEYHLVVHVWIKNNNQEFLITKRTPNKTFLICGKQLGDQQSLVMIVYKQH